MNIELTPEQYKKLTQLVYLGEWMVNAMRDDDHVEKFEDVCQKIYGKAADAGAEDLVDYDEESQTYFPSVLLEADTELNEYREDYNNDLFWDELIERLSYRDCEKTLGADAVKRLGVEKFMDEKGVFVDKYIEEFENHGIENVHVIDL